jgi:hypothetical protein
MNTVWWLISLVLLALFFWLAGMNAVVFWQSMVLRKKTSSWIPLLGGVFGALALLSMPMQGVRWYWWLPLILDWGSLPGILFSVAYTFTRAKSN